MGQIYFGLATVSAKNSPHQIKSPTARSNCRGAGRGWLSQPGESLSLGADLPTATQGLVEGDDAAVQLDFRLGLGVFGA